MTFIDDGEAVIETRDGCPKVKDGGILITLGTVNGDDQKVQVPITGFVACLGATWLTYVVQNRPGTGWRVTGTTGPSADSLTRERSRRDSSPRLRALGPPASCAVLTSSDRRRGSRR
ncbi:hypothetical protein [Micromonospora echinaurantiaca]|uniref:hypothetical protein n=1 Tax=Micromonospora echinaurantiaca TaxID=47857 RepID=UPI0012FE3CD0|nr:hypothetical protein [Micromonospora echinaurantiaca]